jgi:two-component system cell cycle sensor histidine kinase/response regulator CckA
MMKTDKKTKKQLLHELRLLQLRVQQLESLQPSYDANPRMQSGNGDKTSAVIPPSDGEPHIMVNGQRDEPAEAGAKLLDGRYRLSSTERMLIGGDRFMDLDKLLPQPVFEMKSGGTTDDGKNFEEQFRQAQKMEAVGTLAGGIAHDFNNILTAIIASASLMQRSIDEHSKLRRHLDRIFAASERATSLTQSILAYSRKQLSKPAPIKLNLIVENLQKLLTRLIPENIAFKISLSEADLTIMADIGQIEHVVMNLVANSIDAMPSGGELTIKTGVPAVGALDNFQCSGEPAYYCILTVADTGSGMDATTRERLFEPFFTTKEVGRGTGLGLAMVYGIVKQHNGFIYVQSEPGRGTAFDIYFPLFEANARERKSIDSQPQMEGKETILLIEDDTDVRHLLKEILESYGYEVIEGVDGKDGVDKFILHQDKISLLLSDVMMPGKNGKEAYNDIRKIRGDVRVIFISGYSDAATKEILDDGMIFLAKPVSPRVLLSKIREALDK